jgi:hypothetical protein
MNKLIYWKNRNIIPFNLSGEEFERVEGEVRPLLEKYNWTIKSNNDLK